jgi:hypothetical protein
MKKKKKRKIEGKQKKEKVELWDDSILVEESWLISLSK